MTTTASTGTVREWMDRREPAPDPLARRLVDVLEREALLDGPQHPARYLEAAESLLTRMLHEGCAARESALDLLVCDALMTYAFEAGAESPAELRALTGRAMERIGVLVAANGAATGVSA